jgi:hypothetical protein
MPSELYVGLKKRIILDRRPERARVATLVRALPARSGISTTSSQIPCTVVGREGRLVCATFMLVWSLLPAFVRRRAK